jgi:hypothetical protein
VLAVAALTQKRSLTWGERPGKIARSLSGGVPERPKGSDCKSDGSAFVGSNPTPSTSKEFIVPASALALRAAPRYSVQGGYSSKVEPQPSKLMVRVRFPLPAPGAGGDQPSAAADEPKMKPRGAWQRRPRAAGAALAINRRFGHARPPEVIWRRSTRERAGVATLT